MTTFVPSPQQADIFAAVENPNGGNLNVVAVAGAGKTTTLIEAMLRMKGSVAFAAYNKAIAAEITSRLNERGSTHTAKTFHAFGLGAWSRVCRPKIDDKKVYTIIDALSKIASPAQQGALEALTPFLKKAVSLAKQTGAGFLYPIDDTTTWYGIAHHHELEDEIPEGFTLEQGVEYAISVLRESLKLDKEVIDFDDMILAPLVHNAPATKYDWVLIDEAQDTNPARRALAKKMLKAGGRLVAVGDPRQAIYGFTGADADAMDIIAREFNSKEMPLTVTYRCPKAVVAVAQEWVSHIQAHPSAPEGKHSAMRIEEFRKQVKTLDLSRDVVLCRNTRPLVELAYSLIRQGIACNVEGRDIGRGLLALIKRVKSRTLESLLEKLEEYGEAQVQTLMAKGQEMAAEALQDKVETIRVIASQLPLNATVNDLTQKINTMFTDTEPGRQNRLILSTIHKSKGREWNRVWWLGRDRYQPSPFARQAWQFGQEENLMYVAATRSKAELVDLIVPPKAQPEV